MATIKKNAQGYNYTYTDLAAVNDYIESIGESYYQEVETNDSGADYIITVRQKGDKQTRIRGCKIIQAVLSGKNNPAQEAGSGITYARRYSLLMAYGLATEDDDGESYTKAPVAYKKPAVDKTASYDLKMAKEEINESFEANGYKTATQKRVFIKFVLDKETIDNIEDAIEVANKLDEVAMNNELTEHPEGV